MCCSWSIRQWWVGNIELFDASVVERERAYDRDSPIGRLDKGHDEAQARGWALVDMKRDWKVIYPADMK